MFFSFYLKTGMPDICNFHNRIISQREKSLTKSDKNSLYPSGPASYTLNFLTSQRTRGPSNGLSSKYITIKSSENSLMPSKFDSTAAHHHFFNSSIPGAQNRSFSQKFRVTGKKDRR